MNRKKTKPNRPAAPPPLQQTEGNVPAGPGAEGTLRAVFSIWVVVHLFAVFVSFTAVVEPSTIHARLDRLFHPYLRSAHFSADDRPVYLAYGDASEQPHRLQVTTATDIASLPEDAWKAVFPDAGSGLAAADRRARWLSTSTMLAETEQSGLVAELLLPIIERDSSITAIRILRMPTDLNAINTEAESPYVGRVIRTENGVALVQIRADRLSSRAVKINPGDSVE